MDEIEEKDIERAVEKLKKKFLCVKNKFPQDDEDPLIIKTEYDLSQKVLKITNKKQYSTLTWKHIEEIQELKKRITDYKKDSTLKRPLNFLMIADPGSGKSHFIDCLIADKNMESLDISTEKFNMAGLKHKDELVYPLDNIRNIKVKDDFPLLFLDEFDSEPELSYPLLLPLLWDGELFLSHRTLKLGRAVIILAGSTKNIKMFGEGKKPDLSAADKGERKLPDLISRINGGIIKIPSLKERQIDKIFITFALLKKRFEYIKVIPWTLLRFIAMCEFEHEIRSIEHLTNTIPKNFVENPKTKLKDNIPFDKFDKSNEFDLSSPKFLEDTGLIHHLAAPHRITELWHEAKECKILVSIAEDIDVDLGTPAPTKDRIHPKDIVDLGKPIKDLGKTIKPAKDPGDINAVAPVKTKRKKPKKQS